LGQAYNNKAVLLMCLNKYDIALNAIANSNQINPGNIDIAFNYCLCFLKLNNTEVALNFWMEYHNIPLNTSKEDLIKLFKELKKSSSVKFNSLHQFFISNYSK